MNHESRHDGTPDAHGGHGSTQIGGLGVAEHGYALELDETVFASGRQLISFRILGSDGLAVTAFESAHGKDLHFIAVRRDTSGFQHVHPVMDASGTWSVELDLTPGDWRFLADFQPTGDDGSIALGIDAAVAGQYDPVPLPGTGLSAELGDYTVTLSGALLPATASALTFAVSKNGAPVTDLEPYLAAYGHLVALRVGDLGYLHVHPEGGPGDGASASGPEISFMGAAPTPGFYRLYLDFQHSGVVRTAEFTVRASGTSQHQIQAGHIAAGHTADGHHH